MEHCRSHFIQSPRGGSRSGEREHDRDWSQEHEKEREQDRGDIDYDQPEWQWEREKERRAAEKRESKGKRVSLICRLLRVELRGGTQAQDLSFIHWPCIL